MAERMMANFGMPKLDIGNLLVNNNYIGMRGGGGGLFGSDPFANDPFFADSGFGRMD